MFNKFIMILFIALLIFVSGCGQNETKTVLPTVPVKTIKASLGSIEVSREFTGGLVGEEQAEINIRISEAIVDLPYKEGDYVKKGDVIVRLDRGGSTSGYYQAQAAYENARKNYEKIKYLFNEGAVSESDFDNAEASFKVAKANFSSSKETVDLTTPISGVLVDLPVKVGDVPYPGTLAAKVAHIEMLRMTIGVPGKMINRFQAGMEGKLVTTDGEITSNCTVIKVAQAADPATRTFNVDLQVPNEDGKLQAGAFAKVSFVVEEVNDVITVPRSALLSTEGIYELYIVENDTAYSRNIILGVTNDYISGIKEGLEVGEEVVVLGQNFLSDGYPVIRSKEILNDSI